MKASAWRATALAWGLGIAYAQDCASSTGYVIASPGDVDALAGCVTVNGSISVRFTDNPGRWSQATVDLGDVETLIGSLVIYPAHQHDKTTVTASSLEVITGEVTVQSSDLRNTVDEVEVSLPALTNVQDSFAITGGIARLVVDAEAVQAEKLFRVWDTKIEELLVAGVDAVEGDLAIDNNGDLRSLELDVATAGGALHIQQNSRLTAVSLDNLRRVEGDLTVYQNGALEELALPALEFADTISFTSNGPDPSISLPKLASLGAFNTTAASTFEDVGEVDFASLERVQGGLSFKSTSLSRLTLPSLGRLNGSITLEDNAGLTALVLPSLEQIGDIFISSNDGLQNIYANELTQAGTVSIRGRGLANVEFFKLEEVTGDFRVTGIDSMDCTWFDEHVRPVVRGIFLCTGSYEEPAEERRPTPMDEVGGSDDADPNSDETATGRPENGSGPADAPTGSSGGLSTGAQAGIGVGVGLVALLALAALFVYLRRRRTRPAKDALPIEDSSSAEVFDGQHPVKMGTETTIRAVPAEKDDSTPRLSLLNFGLSAGGYKIERPE
ncbi:hypothetical protein S40288_01331 [Stachybotrys chartarum IBT 40288]|nr:hypothetical protein S40288_01331 [Stachybotrys chartarum IBT 40288]